MKKLNSIKKIKLQKGLKVSIIKPAKLLAGFFNVVVMQSDEKCNYES